MLGETPLNYKTIKEVTSTEIAVKKSRFIAVLTPINNLPDGDKGLSHIRQQYPGANHYCFAYVIRQGSIIQERVSDDGEPSGTAGWPILNVLKNNGLENILAVVIRYFGGTLLGTGGLVKAYTEAVQAGLESARIIKMELCRKIVVAMEYGYYDGFEKQFGSIMNQIIDIEFTDRVRIEFWIAIDQVDDFTARVKNLSLGTASVEIGEERYVAYI